MDYLENDPDLSDQWSTIADYKQLRFVNSKARQCFTSNSFYYAGLAMHRDLFSQELVEYWPNF